MAITLEQAKELSRGQDLYHVRFRNSDGTPTRWRVNGMVKTWKRDLSRVKVPIKHGLYDYDYLDENSLDLVCLTAEDALGDERYKVTVKTFKEHKRVDVRDILSSLRWRFKFNLSWSTTNFYVKTDTAPGCTLPDTLLWYMTDGKDEEAGIVLSKENAL